MEEERCHVVHLLHQLIIHLHHVVAGPMAAVVVVVVVVVVLG